MALLLALDQGTTSTRAIIFDELGAIRALAARPLAQHFPAPGWVEHDADEIHAAAVAVMREACAACGATAGDLTAIGITNQRETVVLWERASGRPIGRAIVWQDRRTAARCDGLRAAGHEAAVQQATGLLLDPYFSATKLEWLIDHHGVRDRAERGELLAGTIDTFLLWRLSGGQAHRTDATNASRTLLYDLISRRWDARLLELFRIPACVLPEVCDSGALHGQTTVLGSAVPIAAMVGDQQAAAIGQGCLQPGMAKATFGTGCFLMVRGGASVPRSRNRLLGTVALQERGVPTYALEGSIFNAGSVIEWLCGLNLLRDPAASGALAAQADPEHGITMVPAFTGLGAPHWDPHARGAILGLSRATSAADIVQAALAALACQVCDLFTAMRADGVAVRSLRVDGGMAGNDQLLQLLADLSGIPVERPTMVESTALGAALVAGTTMGIFPSLLDASRLWRLQRRFTPAPDEAGRARRLADWSRAVAVVRGFAQPLAGAAPGQG